MLLLLLLHEGRNLSHVFILVLTGNTDSSYRVLLKNNDTSIYVRKKVKIKEAH